MYDFENLKFFLLFFGFIFILAFMLLSTVYMVFHFNNKFNRIFRIKYSILYIIFCTVLGVILFLKYDMVISVLHFGGFSLIIISMGLIYQLIKKMDHKASQFLESV